MPMFKLDILNMHYDVGIVMKNVNEQIHFDYSLFFFFITIVNSSKIILFLIK
jgi:hypothetical protein